MRATQQTRVEPPANEGSATACLRLRIPPRESTAPMGSAQTATLELAFEAKGLNGQSFRNSGDALGTGAPEEPAADSAGFPVAGGAVGAGADSRFCPTGLPSAFRGALDQAFSLLKRGRRDHARGQ